MMSMFDDPTGVNCPMECSIKCSGIRWHGVTVFFHVIDRTFGCSAKVDEMTLLRRIACEYLALHRTALDTRADMEIS